MVNDPDRDVRLQVISTLSTINDQKAAGVLSAQLGRETDSQVKALIAEALGKSADLTAVPALVHMLDDPSTEAAAAAANALADLGPLLRQNDSNQADQTADAIQRIFDTRTAPNKATDLRTACMSALAALSQPKMMDLFLKLVPAPGETDAVHRYALAGLETSATNVLPTPSPLRWSIPVRKSDWKPLARFTTPPLSHRHSSFTACLIPSSNQRAGPRRGLE